jgi:uncharacterized BrkB/YihY/UPF0761 family membrane protein
MAELRDVPIVVRRMGAIRFGRKVWREVGDDNLFTWASALAYSWLFAVFPFLLVLLSLIPLLRYEWRVAAKDQINNAVHQLPHEAQVTIGTYLQPKLDALLFEKSKGITAIWSVGLLITLWAASGGMAMTMAAMDRCYDVERMRPFYKQRPLAVALTTVVAALILAVVVLIPVGTIVTRYLTRSTEKLLTVTKLDKLSETAGLSGPAMYGPPKRPTSSAPAHAAGENPAAASNPVAGAAASPGDVKPPAETTQAAKSADGSASSTDTPEPSEPRHRFMFWIWLWEIFRYALALLFLFWVVGLVYHFGPNVKQKFRLITPGAVFTIAVWILLGFAFRVYVDRFGKYGQTYGAVGGVIILLFFFYIDALVLLIGAEINSEIDAAQRQFDHEQSKPPPPEETKDTEPAVQTP